MLLSVEWLREWINPQQDTQQIAYDLTQAGLEVESINNPPTEHLHHVIVAEILEAVKHPNADRLKLCKVHDGSQELSIVCGAPNARAGIKVALASVGTILPGDFKIKESKIRGSLSQGMLCSAKELQLSEEHQGIMELPEAAEIGKPVSEYLQLPTATMDIAITPNRGDCLSIRGIARDLAAIYATKLSPPTLKKIPAQHQDELPIELEAPEHCPRYFGRIIKGIDLSKPSPDWMQKRLRDSGLNPINIAVDVTNYVMQELGQPLHAFDLRRLEGGIKVRLATKGEELILLDESVMKLDEEVLLIADHKKPLALGGIMGGKDSGIADDTTEVFLEAAVFSPQKVFSTRQKYNLSTEAAYRFERFVDPTLPELAIERATELLIATAGGAPGPISTNTNINDSEKHLPVQSTLQLEHEFVSKFLGFSLSAKQIEKILGDLGFTLDANKGGWQVTIPIYRPDIDCPASLCEELARVYGYDKIEQTLPRGSLKPQHFQSPTSTDDEIRAFLTARGFSEVINYSFISKEESTTFYPNLQPLELANPISSDMSVMRPSIIPGLLKILARNQRRQVDSCNLFEMGQCFVPSTTREDKLAQKNCLVFAAMRPQSSKRWQENLYDFNEMLNDVTDLLSSQGLLWGGALHGVAGGAGQLNLRYATPATNPSQPSHSSKSNKSDNSNDLSESHLFHPTKHIYIDRLSNDTKSASKAAARPNAEALLGIAGMLHPRIVAASKLQGYEVYLCSMCLDDFPSPQVPSYTPFSDLPAANFELSLIIPEAITYVQLVAKIRECFETQPDKIELLDVYQSDKLQQGYKSMALLLKWQPTTSTLTDEQVNSLVFGMLKKLASKHDIKLRS